MVTVAITCPEVAPEVSTPVETTITSKVAATELAREATVAEVMTTTQAGMAATAMTTTTAPVSHIDQRSIARARLGLRHLNHRRCRRADRQYRTQSGGRQY